MGTIHRIAQSGALRGGQGRSSLQLAKETTTTYALLLAGLVVLSFLV